MGQMVRLPRRFRNPVLQNDLPPLGGIADFSRSVRRFRSCDLAAFSQHIIRYHYRDPWRICGENVSVPDGLLNLAGRSDLVSSSTLHVYSVRAGLVPYLYCGLSEPCPEVRLR